MKFFETICGIDEVGRGPLAGPVTAACVYIPDDTLSLPFWAEITDSKKLSAKKREALYPLIMQHAICGIGECSAAEIDDLNIHNATLEAMKRAFHDMSFRASDSEEESPNAYEISRFARNDKVLVLIDGKFCPNIPCAAEPVIKGDSKHLQIAAASIIAKVTRDRQMADLDAQYPHYGWVRNAAYGTAEHRAAIEQFGITPHHRKSFAPCRDKPLAA